MKKFYRILCISSLGVLISTVVAHASVVLMGVAMATLGAIIAGTGLLAGYSIMQAAYPGTGAPASGAATVTPAGTIGRQTTVQWVDLKDLDTSGAPKVKQSDKTVRVKHSDLSQKVLQDSASRSKYPRLATALERSRIPEPPVYSTTLGAPGDLSSVGLTVPDKRTGSVTGWAKITGVTGTVTYGSGTVPYSGPGVYLFGTSLVYAYAPQEAGRAWNFKVTATSNVPPPEPVVSQALPYQYANSLANSPSDSLPLPASSPVFSDYLGEIDDFIKDNPGSVSIIEGSHDGVSDSAPPATLPAPVTQASYDAAAAAGGASVAAGQAAASSAGSLATAQSNYNANPSPENAQKLADAQAEYDKLVAEQKRLDAEKVLSDLGDEEAKEKVGGSGFGGDDAYGDPDKDFDLGNRFKTFFDEMKTTAVFSLPNEFLTNIPDSSETSISFDGGRFGVQTFDFATFATLWSGLKAVILVAFGWFAIRIAVLKGGSS